MAEKHTLPWRFHDVTLHGRGKSNRGTLRLEKHHLTFTFAPEDGGASKAPSAQDPPRAIKAGSSVSDASSKSQREIQIPASSASTGTSHSAEKRRVAHGKPKTIWIPYPMINSCMLRPTNSQSVTARAAAGTPVADSFSDGIDSDGWPSTHGTSSPLRPSTDSNYLSMSQASPARSVSPTVQTTTTLSDRGRSPVIRIRCRDFQMMAIHFHSSASGQACDEIARKTFFELRSRCSIKCIEDLLAFHFQPPHEELEAGGSAYDARMEYARMGISGKTADGPGTAWRLSDINHDYSFSETYPSVLCVPRTVSDNMLKYGGVFRSRQRVPCLSYLHHNGGSITRSSQPKVGPFGKRNPQDEKLVTAIMSSHTPPLTVVEDSSQQVSRSTSPSTATLESMESETPSDSDPSDAGPVIGAKPTIASSFEYDVPFSKARVYGSMRRNFIMDARPRTNATVNKAGGGGYEDINNYSSSDAPVEQIFLNIANIHVMRSSLQQVIESFANSDYLALAPNQEALRKSGWLSKHIYGILEGANKVARAVGLAGSHALVHCSDGWDRTAQVSALAQIMLDPHYRTMDGFIALVQKDFLSFGHKFKDRNGILGSEKWFEIENERILPSQDEDGGDTKANNFGQKAISSTKIWIDRTRGSLFSKGNTSRESLAEGVASLPPNSILHSPANAPPTDEKKERTKLDEISPVFHQFLDAVWQLQRQYPSAFEFNERFLSRLLYQVYAGQYGEFLFNNERERLQHVGKLPSVWAYFLARKAEFANIDYIARPEEALLLPKWTEPEKQVDVRELRWWTHLFRRDDKEMNASLALSMEPSMAEEKHSSISFDPQAENLPGHGLSSRDTSEASLTTLESMKSTPVLVKRNSIISGVAALKVAGPVPGDAAADDSTSETPRPSNFRSDASFVVVPESDTRSTSANGSKEVSTPSYGGGERLVRLQMDMDDGGDPLGVASTVPTKASGGGGLDFAAFAQQAAYRDR